MWIYHSPIGIIEIKYDNRAEKLALWLNDVCGGYYLTPEAAADDVFTQHSGIDAIDDLEEPDCFLLPHDLGEWIKVPDK